MVSLSSHALTSRGARLTTPSTCYPAVVDPCARWSAWASGFSALGSVSYWGLGALAILSAVILWLASYNGPREDR